MKLLTVPVVLCGATRSARCAREFGAFGPSSSARDGVARGILRGVNRGITARLNRAIDTARLSPAELRLCRLLPKSMDSATHVKIALCFGVHCPGSTIGTFRLNPRSAGLAAYREALQILSDKDCLHARTRGLYVVYVQR